MTTEQVRFQIILKFTCKIELSSIKNESQSIWSIVKKSGRVNSKQPALSTVQFNGLCNYRWFTDVMIPLCHVPLYFNGHLVNPPKWQGHYKTQEVNKHVAWPGQANIIESPDFNGPLLSKLELGHWYIILKWFLLNSVYISWQRARSLLWCKK